MQVQEAIMNVAAASDCPVLKTDLFLSTQTCTRNMAEDLIFSNTEIFERSKENQK